MSKVEKGYEQLLLHFKEAKPIAFESGYTPLSVKTFVNPFGFRPSMLIVAGQSVAGNLIFSDSTRSQWTDGQLKLASSTASVTYRVLALP